jgi:hypothetical protein
MSHLDTLKEYKRLVESGIPEAHAYATIEASFNILNVNTEGLARISDIQELKAAGAKDIQELRGEIGLLAKDFLYLKLMVGGMFALGALPIIKQFLKIQ